MPILPIYVAVAEVNARCINTFDGMSAKPWLELSFYLHQLAERQRCASDTKELPNGLLKIPEVQTLYAGILVCGNNSEIYKHCAMDIEELQEPDNRRPDIGV